MLFQANRLFSNLLMDMFLALLCNKSAMMAAKSMLPLKWKIFDLVDGKTVMRFMLWKRF
jgi:hypothetical protein